MDKGGLVGTRLGDAQRCMDVGMSLELVGNKTEVAIQDGVEGKLNH